jgi:acetyl-CoA carboxylase beta subunit
MRGPRASSPSARDAIQWLSDEFHELEGPVSGDPLGWPGYPDKLAQARADSGEDESVVTGHARLDGQPLVLIAMDFRFLGGSMGAATGVRICRALDEARRARCVVVSLIASGGARIQEGMCSLVQMQRVAAAQARLRSEGIAHIAVLRHPTTGGVWAALGSVADVIYALPDATVAFTGARVRGAGEQAGEDFTAEGKLRQGAIDRVVEENELRDEVALAVTLLRPSGQGGPRPAEVPAALFAEKDELVGAWEHVLRTRRPSRPHAARYLDSYFQSRMAISGDRAGGHDPGMLCGFGRREGRTIAFAAQTGTPNTPAGYRTAARLVELAGRLRLPVLTLIDTPGAANDAVSERGAIGTAIGELFQRVASSSVPITSLVIGEGGSGGALALASERPWIAPDGYFAVIAPEGAAAILERDESLAPEMAERLELRPSELLKLGIVRGIACPEDSP